MWRDKSGQSGRGGNSLENTLLLQNEAILRLLFCLKFVGKDYRGQEEMTNCPVGQRSLWMTIQLCLWYDFPEFSTPVCQKWPINHASALQKTLFNVRFAEITTPFLLSQVVSGYLNIELLLDTEYQDFTVKQSVQPVGRSCLCVDNVNVIRRVTSGVHLSA